MWATPVISRMFRAGICTDLERQSCLAATATTSKASEAEESDGAWGWNNRDASSCSVLKGDRGKSTSAHGRSHGHDSVAVVGQSITAAKAEAEVVG